MLREFHWCLAQNTQNFELILIPDALPAAATVEDPSIIRCSKKKVQRYPGSPCLDRRSERAHSNAPLDPDGVNNTR